MIAVTIYFSPPVGLSINTSISLLIALSLHHKPHTLSRYLACALALALSPAFPPRPAALRTRVHTRTLARMHKPPPMHLNTYTMMGRKTKQSPTLSFASHARASAAAFWERSFPFCRTERSGLVRSRNSDFSSECFSLSYVSTISCAREICHHARSEDSSRCARQL